MDENVWLNIKVKDKKSQQIIEKLMDKKEHDEYEIINRSKLSVFKPGKKIYILIEEGEIVEL